MPIAGKDIQILLLGALISLPHLQRCYTMDNARKLLRDKMAQYDTNFRPKVNQSSPVIVHTFLSLVSIQEFDEVQEILTVTAAINLNWTDEYMQWNETDYNEIKSLVVLNEKVWTPDIVLINNVNKIENMGKSWGKVRFNSDGTAYFYKFDVFSASCKADVTYYPWDSHRCAIKVSAWTYSESEVQLRSTYHKVQTDFLSENGVWNLYNSAADSYGETYLEFHLFLNRKPRFVIVNVIIPIIFMAYLNVVIFLIPAECGERISYSITVLLAIAVFLTVIGENLPKTSSPLSCFSYYLLAILIISICITLASVFSLRVYHREASEPVTSRWVRFVKCLNFKRKKKMTRTHLEQLPGSETSIGETRDSQSGNKKKMHDNVSSHTMNNESTNISVERKDQLNKRRQTCCIERDDFLNVQSKLETTETEEVVTWKDVSFALDAFFFALITAALTISTAVYFVYILLGIKQ